MLTRVEFKIGCRWSKTTEKKKKTQTNKRVHMAEIRK